MEDIKQGLGDIRYNFLIGLDIIIEGRGWDVKPNLTDHKLNNSMAIGFFTDYIFKEGELTNTTLTKLVADGQAIGKISKEVTELCTELCTGIPDTTTTTQVPDSSSIPQTSLLVLCFSYIILMQRIIIQNK